MNFYRHILFAIQEVHGHFDDNVQAAIPVWLWVFNVVFHLDDLQVILHRKHFDHGIYIVDVRNNNAHTCNV